MTNLGNVTLMIRISILSGLRGVDICRNTTAHFLPRPEKTEGRTDKYRMQTFYEWLRNSDIIARLWLIETYFTFDPAQYNQLFDDELGRVLASSPEHRAAVERMRGMNWTGYIAKSLRNSGYRDQREVAERTHDIVVKLLTGGLFRDYDERQHGALDLRFKRSVANAIKNMVEKQRNARRLLPSVPIDQEFRPGGTTDLPDRPGREDDERMIDDFRQLVRSRLGELGSAVLDARLAGQETKSLVGRKDLGSPGRFVVKRVVGQIKTLANEYAQRLGDPALLRDVERAMDREGATIQKRRVATATRQGR